MCKCACAALVGCEANGGNPMASPKEGGAKYQHRNSNAQHQLGLNSAQVDVGHLVSAQ